MLLEGTGDDEDQYQSSPSSASNGNEDQVNNNRINSNVAPYHYQEVPNQKISLSCFTDKQVCQLSDNLSIALQKHCFCYSSPPIQQLTMFGDNGVDCSSEKPFMFRLDDDDAPLSGTSRVVRAAFDLAFTNGCLSRLKMGRAPTLHLLLPLSYPHEAVQIAANEQDRQQRTMLDEGDEDKANKLADLGPLAEQRLRQRIDQGAVNRYAFCTFFSHFSQSLTDGWPFSTHINNQQGGCLKFGLEFLTKKGTKCPGPMPEKTLKFNVNSNFHRIFSIIGSH